MLEVAAELAGTRAALFVRVDMYEDSDGLVVGEITSQPPACRVWDAVADEFTGTAWEYAQAARLAADARAAHAGSS